jgi:hypothetical protein
LGIVGAAVAAWLTVALAESYELLRMIICGALKLATAASPTHSGCAGTPDHSHRSAWRSLAA